MWIVKFGIRLPLTTLRANKISRAHSSLPPNVSQLHSSLSVDLTLPFFFSLFFYFLFFLLFTTHLLWSTYSMPGPAPGAGDTDMIQTQSSLGDRLMPN